MPAKLTLSKLIALKASINALKEDESISLGLHRLLCQVADVVTELTTIRATEEIERQKTQ